MTTDIPLLSDDFISPAFTTAYPISMIQKALQSLPLVINWSAYFVPSFLMSTVSNYSTPSTLCLIKFLYLRIFFFNRFIDFLFVHNALSVTSFPLSLFLTSCSLLILLSIDNSSIINSIREIHVLHEDLSINNPHV